MHFHPEEGKKAFATICNGFQAEERAKMLHTPASFLAIIVGVNLNTNKSRGIIILPTEIQYRGIGSVRKSGSKVE